MTQFEIFVGIDLPTETRQTAVIDPTGEVLASAFAHSGDGLTRWPTGSSCTTPKARHRHREAARPGGERSSRAQRPLFAGLRKPRRGRSTLNA